MKRSYKYYVVKGHRYLGIFIGIQFALWTISGVFFAWTNITEIRGEHLRKETASIKLPEDAIAPTAVGEAIGSEEDTTISSLRVVNVLGKPFYEVTSKTGDGKNELALVDIKTGKRRSPVSENEAGRIATAALVNPLKIRNVIRLTEDNVGGHHEYRDQPLPAYAVEFEHPENLVVYVTADTGQVRSFRTSNWRIFDFLWMMHTMDFWTRDNINNWSLRIFSALGILMIISGYWYFFMTFRRGSKGSSAS